ERRALSGASEAATNSSTEDATKKILNIKSLRDDGKKGLASADIRTLFVGESLSQLGYCVQAIHDLKSDEQRAWETGYLFRVMQSIRQAAGAIEATDVGRLAAAAESCFSILRLKPSAYDISRQDFLSNVIKTLVGAVEAFSQGH